MQILDTFIGAVAKGVEEPAQARRRQQALNDLKDAGALSVITMIAAAALAISGLAIAVSGGVFAGTLVMVLSAGLGVIAHDFSALCANGHEMIDDDKAYGRALRSDASQRANMLFKGFWVADKFMNQREKENAARELLKV